MRAVVRAHPTITVHELAREMGYSEDRSVYYWLRKAGFRGLRDFKESVLTDQSDVVGELTYDEYGTHFHIIETSEFSPWLLPGDRLIVDPTQRPRDGSLVLVHVGGTSTTIRRYIEGAPSLLLHPTNPRDVVRLDPSQEQHGLAQVVRLIRDLP